MQANSGAVLDANPAASEMYGYSHEELLQLRAMDISSQPEETERAFAEQVKQVPLRYHRRKDGTIFPVEVLMGNFEYRGQRVHVAAIRDITRRQRAEDELRTSRLQLTQAMELAQLVHWEYDPVAGNFLFNDRFYGLYGTAAERQGGYFLTPAQYLQLVLPDDRARVAQEMGKSAAHKSGRE